MNHFYGELRTLMPPLIPGLGPRKAMDIRAVEKALERASSNSMRVFVVLVGMIGVLFVLEIAIFIAWASQPGKAAAVASASGVTLPFLLYFLRDSWRTKVQADTLLALATSLDAPVVQSIVRSFLASVATRRG